jgi:repressor LexA
MVNNCSSSGVEADLESAFRTHADGRERELIGRLARRRTESGLSQTHVAELMQTSQSAVARLESGRHDVQLSTLARYAEVLGFALDLTENTTAQAGAPGEGPSAEADETAPRELVSPGQQSRASGRPKGRPGRKPKQKDPAVVTQVPDRPDPAHVLTWRQRKILQVIRDSVQERGYPPSMREIGEAVGLTTTSGVSHQLSTLQKKGYLHRDVGRPRTVRVRLPGHPLAGPEPGREEDRAVGQPGVGIDSQEAIYVPLAGRVAAGPVVAEQNVKDGFRLPRQLVGEGVLFMLEVTGDSMINTAIADGDRVVVRQQKEADNGGLVAAVIDGETTVNAFKQSGVMVWLIQHNPAYTPIPGDEATIPGRVVAVLRRV